MIDLTPLDVRKKKGDFARGLRGYDPQEVDTFLDLVADRLEALVREHLALKERLDRQAQQLQGQEGREKAVNEALVSAQTLRTEIQDQARREADLLRREAEAQAQEIRRTAESAVDQARGEVERVLQDRRRELQELNRARARFLKSYRNLLERELDNVEIEESTPPPDHFDIGSGPATSAPEVEGIGDGEWKEDW